MVTATILSVDVQPDNELGRPFLGGKIRWYWVANPTLVFTNSLEGAELESFWLAADDGTGGPTPVFFEV